MKDKTGGPAFPVPEEMYDEGMTLLDYFAIKAMQGMLNGVDWWVDDMPMTCDQLPGRAYEMASAMIKEREKWTE